MSPFALLYGKRAVDPSVIEDVELAALVLLEEVALDRISGEGKFEMGCALLVIMQALAADHRNRQLYDLTKAALDAWFTAGTVRVEHNRPTVQPSTQQRKALAEVLRRFPQVLRQVNRGSLAGAARAWLRHRVQWQLEGEPAPLIVRLALGG